MFSLNFFDSITFLLVPFADCICILDTHQQQCVVLVSYEEMGGTKVLSTIQLVEDVYCVENINLVDWSTTKTP